MPDIVDQIGLEGWVVERKHSHYSLGYWVAFIVGMLDQTVPPPPRITYTLRNSSSGERHTVTLAGDHRSSELVEAITRSQTEAS